MLNFRRRLMLNIGLLVLTLLVYGAVSYFILEDVTAQGGAVALELSERRTQAELSALFASLKQDSTEVDAYQAKLNKLLPTKDQLLGITRVLEGLARENRVTISFEFQGASVEATPTQLGYNGFNLRVQGERANVSNFLNLIEARSTGFLLSLSHFSVSRSGDSYEVITAGRLFFR